MDKDFVHKQMKKLDINVSKDELVKTFTMLDIDDSGELTIEEFVDGLGYLQEGLATKHIVNVDYSLKRVEKRVDSVMETINESINGVMEQHGHILQALRQQEIAHDGTQMSMWLFRKWLGQSPCPIDGL